MTCLNLRALCVRGVIRSLGFAALVLAGGLSTAMTAQAAGPQAFSFAALGFPADDALEPVAELDGLIRESDEENLAFLASIGIKQTGEACSDALYQQRKTMLEGAKNGVAYVLAGRDWIGCTTQDGQSVFAERLTHLREVFFSSHFMLGESKLPQSTQSAMPQFRVYEENRRWQVGGIQFATLNVPAQNNHYLPYGGRNGEFEDRVVANRAWLKNLFAIAERRKSPGVVLFMDGDPRLITSGRSPKTSRVRDGFLELRKQLQTLTGGFRGEVLVIHQDGRPAGAPAGRHQKSGRAKIRWNGNLGDVSLEEGSLTVIRVAHRRSRLFMVTR